MYSINFFFFIYGPGGHIGHLTWTIHTNYGSPLIGQAVSERKVFENNCYVHVYSPWAGADNSLGSNLLQKHKFSVNLVICCKFIPLNDFVTVFSIQTHRRPKEDVR